MKVRNVKVNSLASVFTDSTLSTFTSNAINKGVTDDSIIYIVCGANDTTYGSQYTEGSHWIWAKGEMFGSDPVQIIDLENIINFTIDESIYTAVIGDTFNTWIASENNIDDYYIEDDQIYDNTGALVLNVNPDTIILDGDVYEKE